MRKRSDATVERITIDEVDVELAEAFVGSTYHHAVRSTFVTTIGLGDGTTAVATSGHGHGDPARVAQWARRLSEEAVGWSVFDGDVTWRRLRRRAGSTSVLEQPFAMAGVAVIDIALWHARGVALGEPICRLLGAEPVALPTMLIGGYYRDGAAADAASLADAAVETGTSAVKVKVGGGDRTGDDVAKLDALLERIEQGGGALGVVCDANRAWDLDRAAEFLAAVADGRPVEWVEEPLLAELERVMARGLRQRFGVAIGSGQSTTSPESAMTLIESGAMDVVNVDASWVGGISGWLRVRDVAERRGLRVAHHAEPHLAMHVLAGIDRPGFVEVYSPPRDPAWHRLIQPPPIIDGHISAPDRPGLGIDVDADFVAHQRRNKKP